MSALLTSAQASAYAKMALEGIQREYPNHLAHVLEGPQDLLSPKALHPAFFGCYDWHSAVHSHWMLVRLLRRFDLVDTRQIEATVKSHLSKENMEVEAAYFNRPGAISFERPYGWGWLLKLAAELSAAPSFAESFSAIQPLVRVIVDRFHAFLPKQTYPIRLGTHTNTAFGMALAYDYSVTVNDTALQRLLADRAVDYFGEDQNYPAGFEPGGADFLSPALCEAEMMRRTMQPDTFVDWFHAFLPELPPSLRNPATVSDRHDPQVVHLDGLNLSRAWCLAGIADALPESSPTRATLARASSAHAEAGFSHVSSGDYLGEHWLASFAVYLGTDAWKRETG